MSRLIILLKLSGVTALYVLLARVTLIYLSTNGVVSLVWLPSGLALGALGHRLKSPARMAGAMGFADMCQTLEKYGKNDGSMEQIQGVVSRMRPQLERINEQINKDLA